MTMTTTGPSLGWVSTRLLTVLFVAAMAGVGCSGDGEPPEDTNQEDTGDAANDEPDKWPAPRPGCNGDPDLCDRPFPEVVFPATHNAMSNEEEGWEPPNQNLDLATQLVDGVRGFLLDIHEDDGEILLCHVFCQLGSRPLVDAMEEFRSFLEANPDEIITIIFEDHIPADETVEVLEDAAIDDFVYTHSDEDGWPTLQEMIDDDTRLVVVNEQAEPPPQWMHHIWEIGWDTPYEFSSIDDFNCDHNRGTRSGELFLINHWVSDPLPDPDHAGEVNQYATLIERVEECEERWERLPTFVAVDFYDVGDLFEVVDVLNGVASPR